MLSTVRLRRACGGAGRFLPILGPSIGQARRKQEEKAPDECDHAHRERHRSHLQPRHSGAEGRVAHVEEGRIVALLGGNGAGKTTTLRAVSNLLKGERGEVTKGYIELRVSASKSSRLPIWSSAA